MRIRMRKNWPYNRHRCWWVFDTFAFHVLASASVTELVPTTTHHMVAPLVLLHPVLTLCALLELVAPDELIELLVVFVDFAVDLVLFARHALVFRHSAVETIGLVALGTSECCDFFVKDEGVAAIRGGTP